MQDTEMTQDMVDDFYYTAATEWKNLLDSYQLDAIEFINSEHKNIAMEYLAKYQYVKDYAESLGFTLPALVEGVGVKIVYSDDDSLKEDLSPNRTLH